MFEEIKYKIYNDIDTDLNVDELKVLYGIDNVYSNANKELIIYRRKDIYLDFCKIFGKSHVARTTSSITEDTIAYIGDLTIEKKLPTYNLKYIYGSLNYRLDKIYNLENLEVIYRNANLRYIKCAEGLENLKLVGLIDCTNLENSEGLENLKYIQGVGLFPKLKIAKGLISLKEILGGANFTSLEYANGLENLEIINYGSADFPNLKNSESLINLKYIRYSAWFNNIKSAKGLEKLEYIGLDAYFPSLENAKYLENLKHIGGSHNFGCDHLTLYEFREKDKEKCLKI